MSPAEIIEANVHRLRQMPVTPNDDGTGRLIVDCTALPLDEYDEPTWELRYVGDGLWQHPYSGTDPMPLIDCLLAIAQVHRHAVPQGEDQ